MFIAYEVMYSNPLEKALWEAFMTNPVLYVLCVVALLFLLAAFGGKSND
jgi:fumarate reductase subunit C